MSETPNKEEAKRIRRSAYRWNTASGMFMAFQSVIMLMVIARACDVQTAGVFTIAYANASLFLYVGKYGMRRFQVSDRNGQFSFGDYRVSRIVTDAAMLISGGIFLAYAATVNGYTVEKTAIMAFMVVFKFIDCSEDVYMGRYQQLDRLDVGARVLTIRMITTIGLFAALVAIMANLLWPLVIATAYTACFYIAEVFYIKRKYGMPGESPRPTARNVGKLLFSCFPLFAATFLLFYIGNAPKYAIDAMMSSADQAYYGYIAMPSFVVTLLAGFVYNPIITSLTDNWLEGKVKRFLKRFAKLALVIIGLTAVCDLAAWIAGVPVLDLLYAADTGPYLGELILQVTGGGFLALTTLAVLGITIIRFQRVLVPVYAVVSIAAWFIANWAVAQWGITGAAWTYFISMVLLSIIFTGCFILGTRLLRSSVKGGTHES